MRDIRYLHEEFKDRVEELLELSCEAGIDLLIYCTYRSPEQQARLYRLGRSTTHIKATASRLPHRLGQILLGVGPQYGATIRTNAAPGQSMHNYGLAIDAVPMRDGKPVWGTNEPEDLLLWNAYGRLCKAANIEWAGNWENFTEYVHGQMPDVHWKTLIDKCPLEINQINNIRI